MDKWWKRPLTVTCTEATGQCIDFQGEMLDFTPGAEIALLEAHIDFKPHIGEFYIKFESSTYGQCHFIFSLHMFKTVEDLMDYLDLRMAIFLHNGQYIPLSEIVSVKTRKFFLKKVAVRVA